MKKFEELLYSLVTVIIRYHDIQPQVKKFVNDVDEVSIRKKSFICAKEIIQNKEIHFKARLHDLIKQCADGGRKPFLHYILHEVTSLKVQLDKVNSFDPIQLEKLKTQIYQLFIDFKHLLDTQKHKTCKVVYSKTEDVAETSIALSGLKNDAYIGAEFCKSGEFLNEGVLKRFNIGAYSSADEIREIAEQICMEHQNALLVPELQAQNTVQKQITEEQEEKLSSLSDQYKETQKKQESTSAKQHMFLYFLYLQIKKLHSGDEKQKKVIKQQQENIEALNEKINELTQENNQPVNHSMYSLF